MGNEDQSPRRVEDIEGKVVTGPLGEGSKSARSAFWLETDQGRFVLRRKDGPSFGDDVLNRYVGKTIECSGVIVGYNLLAEKIRIVPQSK